MEVGREQLVPLEQLEPQIIADDVRDVRDASYVHGGACDDAFRGLRTHQNLDAHP